MESPVTARKVELSYEVDVKGLTRVKYEREGWSYCTLGGHRVHFAEAGDRGGPVVVLVHGYGASCYHWRYQFRALADAGFHVFAIDMIGFGLSEKAAIDYSNGAPWVAQIQEFVERVVQPDAPVVLVGNSLGAYASLSTAAARPDLVRAVAMLNGAGPTRDPSRPPPIPSPLLDPIRTAFKRVVLFFGFLFAKQPQRIKQVLDFVYVNKDQLDADLVTSIQVPATDPAAADVFFRVNNQQGKPKYVDDMLEGFTMPLLLLYGELDPWVVPQRGRKVKGLYPAADLRFIPSGHCPHDDTPELTNVELINWLTAVTGDGSGSTTSSVAEALHIVREALSTHLNCLCYIDTIAYV
ncbi:hypothetical protein FOA52_011717 [Chlamydomonas sp. UWO 241]|nr:hypothetical protein FOA52_011717 [Chlamydomonas sp. UWO 241]